MTSSDAPAESPARPAPEDLLPPPDRRPGHIAIIMDGNRRWADQRGLDRAEGHRRGADSVRAVTRAAARWGTKELTLYAFSAENWSRSEEEVAALMALLEEYLVGERAEIMGNGIRLRAMGQRDRLPSGVLARLRETEEMSAPNPGMVLRLALSYGGRQEILAAARALARRAAADPAFAASFDEAAFRAALLDPDMADPDLLIRTGGERRLSNFLLYQVSYAELLFVDTLWPDFGERDLAGALATYAARVRRFGGP